MEQNLDILKPRHSGLILPDLCPFVISGFCGVFSHDVSAAILVSQSNETAAMFVSQTNLPGVELFSYALSYLHRCWQRD